MEGIKRDAELLAEAHREACTMSADCIKNCPESSPLYWAKALIGTPKPQPMMRENRSVAKVLSGVATVVENQARVIDDVTNLVNEFDGDPEDLPEFLETLRQVLSRSV